MTGQENLVHRSADLVFEDLGGGVQRHVRHGDGFSQLRVRLAEGAVLPAHQHSNEQYTFVVSGVIRYRMAAGQPDEYLVDLEAGDGVWLPSMHPHEAVALTQVETLELFVPGRPEMAESPAGAPQHRLGADREVSS
jgi:quercetin dioxygenase-like cupin family protein